MKKPKIKFIITGTLEVADAFKSDLSHISEKTTTSIQANIGKNDTYGHCFNIKDQESLEQVINTYVADNIAEYKKEKYTHICLVPNESALADFYTEVLTPYIENKDAIYLPIVQYLEPQEEGDPAFRGFLNTCMWKPYGFGEYGQVSLELATKQIDTTLYGAVIPLSLISKHKFKTKIKFYSFFEYLSRVANNKTEIFGVPKVLLNQVGDSEIKNASQEEKVKYFKAAQHEYEHDEDRDIADNYDVSEEVLTPENTAVEETN